MLIRLFLTVYGLDTKWDRPCYSSASAVVYRSVVGCEGDPAFVRFLRFIFLPKYNCPGHHSGSAWPPHIQFGKLCISPKPK